MISVIVWRKECQGVSLIYSPEARCCAEMAGGGHKVSARIDPMDSMDRGARAQNRRAAVQSQLLLSEARLRLDQMRYYGASRKGAKSVCEKAEVLF